MSKYHAKKVKTADGVFDSKAENKRWKVLKIMEEAGEIKNLRHHVPYELIPSMALPKERIDHLGKTRRQERAVMYEADFVYEKDGETIVEDVKGQITRDYIIKRKLMLYIHGIQIHEVY